MAKAADPTSPASARIQAALLDYFEAPGKFPIRSRQPEILFVAIHDVLQIAAGRTPAAFSHVSDELRNAAAFFVGAALLYPGADHYTLLGVPAGCEPGRLKERYRLLMRLIHPDFAGSVRANWPKDSAMRVNRAYEVLSSPVLRREYDEQLAGASVHPRTAVSHAARRSSPTYPRAARVPRLRIGKSAAWGVIVVLSLMAVGMLLPHRDPVRIVQKPKAASGAVNKSIMPVASDAAAPPLPLQAGETVASVAGLMEVARAALAESPAPPPATAPVAAVLPIAAEEEGRAVPVLARPPPLPGPLAPPPPQPEARRIDEPAVRGPQARVVSPGGAIEGPLVAPAPATLEALAPLRTVAIRTRAAPTLAEAQPLLGQLLQSLESGSSEQLLQVLEAEARQAPGALALSRQYQRLVGTSRVTLSQVEFNGEPKDGVLVVVGNLRLQIGQSTIGSVGEKFMVRAEFMSRGGRIALTGLSGVAE